MRLFVTGSTGFIGSHFLNKALESGCEVIALKRNNKSNPRIKLIKEPIWLVKDLDMVTEKDLIGVDVVVHLAAHSMYPPYDTLQNCLKWNLIAPLKLFNHAIDAGISHFVVAGSCFEYGDSGDKYQFIPANAPLKPTLSYSASKAAASISFYQLAKEKKLKLTIDRIFQVFGDGEASSRLWPSLKKAAKLGQDFPMTKGEQIRDFVSVNTVVNTLFDNCQNQGLIKGQPIIKNLGTGEPQSIRQFCEYWWDKWDASGRLLIGELPYREGEVMRYVPEII